MVRERAAAADRRLPLRRDRPAGDADFDVRSDCGGAAGRVAGSLGSRRIAGVGLERRAPATRPAAIPDAGPVADIARPVRLCRRQRLGRRYFGGGFRPGAGGVASGAPGHAGIGIGDDERGLSRRLSRTMAAGTGLDAGQDGWVLAALVGATHMLARLPPARMLTLLWTVLLPLAFLVLALVGAEVLLWK